MEFFKMAKAKEESQKATNEAVVGHLKKALKKSSERDQALKGVNFGAEHKGLAYDTVVGPALREFAAAIGCDQFGPETAPKVVEELSAWEPENPFDIFVKEVLLLGCHHLSDRMTKAHASMLEDSFLLKGQQG